MKRYVQYVFQLILVKPKANQSNISWSICIWWKLKMFSPITKAMFEECLKNLIEINFSLKTKSAFLQTDKVFIWHLVWVNKLIILGWYSKTFDVCLMDFCMCFKTDHQTFYQTLSTRSIKCLIGLPSVLCSSGSKGEGRICSWSNL